MMKQKWHDVIRGMTLGLGVALIAASCSAPQDGEGAAAAPTSGNAVAPSAPTEAVATPGAPAARTVAATDNPLAFLPDPVAMVGDQPIPRADLLEEAKPMLNMIKAQYSGQEITEEQWREMAREVVEGLIEKNILLGLAAESGFVPDAKRGEEEYQKILAEVPEEQVQTVIAQQGITLEELKSKVAVAGTIQDWVAAFSAKILVSDEEVDAFYQEHPDRFKTEEMVEASHILICPEELAEEEAAKLSPDELVASKDKAKAEAKAKAEGLLKRLQDGEDFVVLAEAESDCPSGKRENGRLGEFGRGRMVKPFDEAVFALETGVPSGLVETNFGYHIILKTKHIQEGVTPLAEVREPLKAEMQQRAVGEKIKALLDAEKAKRQVKILI